jgi:amino acid adenylation domain-containing protein
MNNLPKQTAELLLEEKRALLVRLLQERAGQPSTSVFPLSYGQRALWFLYQIAPQSPAYNFALAVRIRSAVDVPALQRAFQALINRHAVLRTNYTVQNGEPVQKVDAHRQVCFEQVDASTLDDETLRKRVAGEYRRPFDLEQGPLLRVTLFTQSAHNHVLLLNTHHIAFDLWSLVILMEELRVLYPAERNDARAALPPLKAQYMDYVTWQADMLAGDEGEQHWSYWQKQLAGDSPELNLPIDRPRPPTQTYSGASHAFDLSDEVVEQLRSLARAERTTLYTVLLAAYQVLLYRYTGQQDIVVGSPMLGRGRPEFKGIVGYFANPVALRGDLSGDPSFKTFLAQIGQVVLEAMEHQDYPLALLVERLKIARDVSRSPLFQVLFTFGKLQDAQEAAELFVQSRTVTAVNYGGLELETFALGQQEGQFDLQLEMDDTGHSVSGILKYNTDLYDVATIARMVGHLQVLLASIAENPDQSVALLPILTASERRQILVDWNDTAVDYNLGQCLHQRIEAQVERTPDATVLLFQAKSLTYRELNERANQLAHFLRTLGVGPETLVGVCMRRSLDMVIGLLGILKAGAAYVPLDPDYPPQHLDFMVQDSQVPVLLTQSRLVPALPEHQAKTVCLDADWEAIGLQSTANPTNLTESGNMAYMIYTSGSTGRPKGTVNTHRGISNRLLWMQDFFQLTETDRVLQKTPFSFDVSVWEFFWPLMTGACLVVTKPDGHRDSGYLVQVIAEAGVTTLHFVPSMLQAFLEERDLERCASVKRVICSGEALPHDLQERFFSRMPQGIALYNLYGPTEAAVDVTYWACRRGSEQRTVPIGQPVSNTQIYLLDPHFRPVPVGVPGELYIGGVQVARGYHGRPGLTAARFIDDPFSDVPGARFYKTGDLARFRPDGNVEFLGRMDLQVKIRGFRVELGEIEAVLGQHPTVHEVVVVAREDTPGDKRLVAYLIVDEQTTPSTDELRRFMRDRLPEYMIPSTFVILDALPLTPNGKIDRRKLPAPTGLRPALETTFVPPRTEIEQTIVTIWRQVLQVQQIGIHDNFFDLGGHSLLAAQVYHQLGEKFGQEVTMLDLFEHPTVAALTKHLTQTDDEVSILQAARERGKTRKKAFGQYSRLGSGED